MKNKCLFFLILFAFPFFYSCEKDKPEIIEGAITDAPFTGYVYKFRHMQNKEIYKTFHSFQEQIDASTIPEDSLKMLSTEGLAMSSMFYPLYGTYYAYSSQYEGIHVVIDISNCLTELSKKKTAGDALIKIYENLFPATDTLFDKHAFSLNIEDRNYFLQVGYLEMLLSTEYFVPNVSDAWAKRLANAIIRHITFQLKHTDIFSYQTIRNTFSAAARLVLCKSTLSIEESDKLNFYVIVSGDPHAFDSDNNPYNYDIDTLQECLNLIYTKTEELI